MGIGLNIEVVAAEPWPKYTTKIITCSNCGVTLELTISSSVEQNKELSCPSCAATLTEQGTSVRLTIAGIPEWLGKYWPALTTTAIAATLFGIFILKKKK